MTDKEILDVVHEVLKTSQEADMGVETDQIVKEQIHFIEQEWQKRDEQELVDQYNRNRKPEDQIKDVSQIAPPASWEKEDWRYSYPPVDPCTSDIKEIERHRGLEIGEDGTVTDLQ